MKVKHLIRELQKCDPEAEVWTEGCDCTGESHRVEADEDGVTVCRQYAHGGRFRPQPGVEYPGMAPAEPEYDNEDDTPEPLPTP